MPWGEWRSSGPRNGPEDQSEVPMSNQSKFAPHVSTVVPPGEMLSVPTANVYLTECASCGGQFPSYRAICSECEDVADVDGYRDGRKVLWASDGVAAV